MEISKEDKERIENAAIEYQLPTDNTCWHSSGLGFKHGAEYEHAHLSQQLKEKEEQIKALRKALKPFHKLAIQCLYSGNLHPDQTVYAYNKANITMHDLRIIDNLLTEQSR